jgi:hypothetical protein
MNESTINQKLYSHENEKYIFQFCRNLFHAQTSEHSSSDFKSARGLFKLLRVFEYVYTVVWCQKLKL